MNISSPGTYDNSNIPPSTTIAAGQMVDSYFLHFDTPVSESSLSGSVTFNTDIVGLIVLDSELDSSDYLSETATIYPLPGTFTRGTLDSPEDVVAVSSDSRTLTATLLRVVASFTDQVRILTQAGDTFPTLVELRDGSFTATASNGVVNLEWKTVTEFDNAGFFVWRGQLPVGETECSDDPDSYTEVTRISDLLPAQGSGASYSYSDKKVASGNTYCYALEDIDLDGTSTFYSDIVSATVP